MTTLEIWLLAISLAMDCFTVSITSGIIMRRICWRTFFIMAFFFGLFQAVMPLIGWFAASRFSHLIEDYDHWIAFGLLAFLGGRMIKESFSNLSPIVIIGFTSFVISTLGSLIGVFCGKRFNLRMELWGGLVLIIIGVKILIEHLFLS